MDIDMKQLRELMRLLKQFDIAEIEVEKDGERIALSRGGLAPAHAQYFATAPQATAPIVSAASSSASEKVSLAADSNVVEITSPFVGTFYRTPSPDAAPFVEVGSSIKPGQPLCIVEAMKLMNEIESEITGTIVEIVSENGKPVEYGDVLFKVRKA